MGMFAQKNQRKSARLPGNWLAAVLAFSFIAAPSAVVYAQAFRVPGSADVGRVKPLADQPLPDHTKDQSIAIPKGAGPSQDIPEDAKKIRFVLKDVDIKGNTAFSDKGLRPFYAPMIGKEVTAEYVFKLAHRLTDFYRDKGYFLSRVYVPEQNIKDGQAQINVVEGYIGEIKTDKTIDSIPMLAEAIGGLVGKRPIKAQDLESFLLRINDLPGLSFRSVLSSMQNPPEEGAVQLTLISEKKKDSGAVTIDNYSSRYLGPHEFTAIYKTSYAPLHGDVFSITGALPLSTLKTAAVEHTYALTPSTSIILNAAYVKSQPGYTLEPFEVKSRSVQLGASVNYNWVRQRQKNLFLQIGVDGTDAKTNFLGTVLTQDEIRALRARMVMDLTDKWGYNAAVVTVSQGLDLFGASDAGDLNISRSGAKPDFRKVEAQVSRLQTIAPNWSVFASMSGQWSSDILYSAEQFGYGGQLFGRAYDSSEIIGDRGIAAAVELRYSGWGQRKPIGLMPYAYYDIGKVWNDAVGQLPIVSAASAGGGVRIVTGNQFAGSLSVAVPLTRAAFTPLYGRTGSGPRVLFQISQGF